VLSGAGVLLRMVLKILFTAAAASKHIDFQRALVRNLWAVQGAVFWFWMHRIAAVLMRCFSGPTNGRRISLRATSGPFACKRTSTSGLCGYACAI
jgi:hypothetical protein